MKRSHNRPDRRVLVQETLEENERRAIDFMKGEGNDEILQQSSSIAEVMRRLRDKIAELDAQAEAGAGPNAVQEGRNSRSSASRTAVLGWAGPVSPVSSTVALPSPTSVSSNGEDSFERHSNHHGYFDTQEGYYGNRHTRSPGDIPVQRQSKEAAELAEESRLLEQATVNLAATSNMKARYAYTDSLDAEAEMHLVLERVKDFYRFVT